MRRRPPFSAVSRLKPASNFVGGGLRLNGTEVKLLCRALVVFDDIVDDTIGELERKLIPDLQDAAGQRAP